MSENKNKEKGQPRFALDLSGLNEEECRKARKRGQIGIDLSGLSPQSQLRVMKALVEAEKEADFIEM